MRRELVVALGASLLLSAWVLLDPARSSRAPALVAPTTRSTTEMTTPAIFDAMASSPAIASSKQKDETMLPATWPAPAMEPAERSPFTSPAPPAPPAAKPVPLLTPAEVAPPPPQTVAYRFWGSLATPTGEHLRYVVREDNRGQPIAVQVGTRLDGGFVVEQVTAGAIVLVEAETQRRVTLSMSPPPTGLAH
jgi:hypothetical protein